MKFNYQFSQLCGCSHTGGNVQFDETGNALLSVVGNRVSLFDLEKHGCSTFAFECRKDVERICLSNNGSLLIAVDVEGRAVLSSTIKGNVLTKINFKKRVKAIQFSPCDRYVAISHGRKMQVWKVPLLRGNRAAFDILRPLVLLQTFTGHWDDVSCLRWSSEGDGYIMSGARDRTTRIYRFVADNFTRESGGSLVRSTDDISSNKRPKLSAVCLSGHKSKIVGCFFRSVSVSPFGLSKNGTNAVITVSKDGSVFLWKKEQETATPASTAGWGDGADPDTLTPNPNP
jgi:periodic tryptophan protein 2